jgi:hypothetical protein
MKKNRLKKLKTQIKWWSNFNLELYDAYLEAKK